MAHAPTGKTAVFLEYSATGKDSSTKMINTADGFCYLMKKYGHQHTRDTCTITENSGVYYVEDQDGDDGNICAAGCIKSWSASKGKAASSEYKVTSEDGSVTMVSTSTGFCYLTTVHSHQNTAETCTITKGEVSGKTGNYWILNDEGGDDGNICGARCVNVPESDHPVSSEHKVTTKDGSADTGVNVDDGFCFLTTDHGHQSTYETCEITQDAVEGKTGKYWGVHDLNGDSNNICGARCITY